MLTPHCSAASGIVVPPSIVSTTRLRKSAEYGFAIHAGLLPAGSLNHIRAAMGIPDSAFPGNALTSRNTGSPAGACHRAARSADPVAGDDGLRVWRCDRMITSLRAKRSNPFFLYAARWIASLRSQ